MNMSFEAFGPVTVVAVAVVEEDRIEMVAGFAVLLVIVLNLEDYYRLLADLELKKINPLKKQVLIYECMNN